MPWEQPELETDPDAVTVRVLENLEDELGGWVATDGAPEVVMFSEIGRETATTNNRMLDILRLAAAGIGETVHGVPVDAGDPAQLQVLLAVTGAGAVVPAGFTVIGTTPAGEEVAFELRAAATSTGPTLTVTMYATAVGAYANDVPAGDLVVATSTATVNQATAVGTSSQGRDPESIDTYLGRFTDYVSILRPGGVLGADMATLARTVPGVHRARAVDLYNATTGEADQDRTLSIYLVDVAGLPVDASTKADVYDTLEAVREPNFVLVVADPTYTAVDVAYSVIADAGQDPDIVGSAIDAAVLAYLSPATWGATTDEPQAWQAADVVRLFDVAAVIGRVPGVASLVTVTLNGDNADVPLSGVAPLPAPADADDPTTVAGTVLA